MKILNEAWAVLSETDRRAAHDQWIAKQEADEADPRTPSPAPGKKYNDGGFTQYTYDLKSHTWSANPQQANHTRPAAKPSAGNSNRTRPGSAAPKPDNRPPPSPSASNSGSTDSISKFALISPSIGVLILGLILLVSNWLSTPGPIVYEAESPRTLKAAPPAPAAPPIAPRGSSKDYLPGSAILREDSQKPSLPSVTKPEAPNGKPWPLKASYLNGMPVAARGGLSKVTVDGTSSNSDAYVKLCRVSQGPCKGLRHIFIPSGEKFTMEDVAKGAYEIRYKDLKSGYIGKSEPIELEEISEGFSTQFSVVTLTLYQIVGGNTSFTQLPEDQF